MKSTTVLRSKFAQTLAAASILAAMGIASANAQTAGNPPPQGQAAQGQSAPSKATCEKEAKAQGLSGSQAKSFVDQCMHGG